MPISSMRLPSISKINREKKVPKLIGVAVDALDHLAGGVFVVVCHVEGQGVVGEVFADVVRGGPADALGEVGREDLHDLLDHGDDDEEDGGGGELFEWATLLRLVDEVANDLGQDELKAEACEEQDAECDDPRKLRQACTAGAGCRISAP